MAAVRVCEEDLIEQARALVPRLRSAGRPLALLAHNGTTALVGRQLANTLAVPLVPINPLLAPGEIAHILNDCGSDTLLVEEELLAKAEAALASEGSQAPRILVSSAAPLIEADHLHYEGSRLASFDASDIGATLIYTSGTTGKPKGCMRTAAQEFARAKELIQTFSLSSTDRQLVASPLAHSAPGIFVRAAQAVGANSIILRKFRPQAFWNACTSLACTFFFLVPTQYRRLLEECQHETVPRELRVSIVAGAPLPARLHSRLIRWLGPNRLWQFYGSSETGTIAIAPPGETVQASVGRLAPGVEMQIRNEKGEQCAPGSVGEMFVRSPTVMRAYLGQARSTDDDGFVSVGDLGYQDEAGLVYLVDRKHDTIISGGINVYPAEVEAALLAHAQVQAAVVVGLEDEDWGQRVVALVATSEPCTSEEMRLHCRPLLAPYKIPKEVHFRALDDMPIGASGKPLRRRARASLRA